MTKWKEGAAAAATEQRLDGGCSGVGRKGAKAEKVMKADTGFLGYSNGERWAGRNRGK